MVVLINYFFQLYRRLLALTGELKGDLHSGTGSDARSVGEGTLLRLLLLLFVIFFELGRLGNGGGAAVAALLLDGTTVGTVGSRGSGVGEVHK